MGELLGFEFGHSEQYDHFSGPAASSHVQTPHFGTPECYQRTSDCKHGNACPSSVSRGNRSSSITDDRNASGGGNAATLHGALTYTQTSAPLSSQQSLSAAPNTSTQRATSPPDSSNPTQEQAQLRATGICRSHLTKALTGLVRIVRYVTWFCPAPYIETPLIRVLRREQC